MGAATTTVRTSPERDRPVLRLVECRTDSCRSAVDTTDIQMLQGLAAAKSKRLSKPDERDLFAIYGRVIPRMQELAQMLESGAGEDDAAMRQELARLKEAKRLAEETVLQGLHMLVWKKARGIRHPKSISIQDLVQVGEAAITEYAMPKFDPALGYRFYTYCMSWSRRAMDRYIHDCGREIRKPTYLHLATSRIERFTSKRFCLTGEYPSIEEIAEGTGLRRSSIMHSMSVPMMVSINEKLPRDGPRRIDRIPDRRAGTPEELLSQKEIAERLLMTLKPRDADMVRRRFGFDDHRMHTFAEIGREEGISTQRARQVITNAMESMGERLMRQPTRWGCEPPRDEGPVHTEKNGSGEQ